MSICLFIERLGKGQWKPKLRILLIPVFDRHLARSEPDKSALPCPASKLQITQDGAARKLDQLITSIGCNAFAVGFTYWQQLEPRTLMPLTRLCLLASGGRCHDSIAITAHRRSARDINSKLLIAVSLISCCCAADES